MLPCLKDGGNFRIKATHFGKEMCAPIMELILREISENKILGMLMVMEQIKYLLELGLEISIVVKKK